LPNSQRFLVKIFFVQKTGAGQYALHRFAYHSRLIAKGDTDTLGGTH
jgi:hypothetical protein